MKKFLLIPVFVALLISSDAFAITVSLHGPSSACPGSTQNYSIDVYWSGIGIPESLCNITWTVFEDGVMVHNAPGGQNFNHTFGQFQGTATVRVSVGQCGVYNGNTQKDKTVTLGLVAPSSLSGPSVICKNVWSDFSIPLWANNSSDCFFHYTTQWDAPSGWSTQIASGGVFKVKPPSSASSGNYTIRVRGTNHPAGVTPWRSKTVYVGTPSTVEIAGSSHQACENDYDGFGATGATGATSYTWTLPSGWGFSGPSTTKNITASTTSTGGNISVRANNVCGNSNTDTESVSVIDCGGGHLLLMYPNPSTYEVSFDLVETTEKKETESEVPETATVKIIDGNQNVVSESEFTIGDGLNVNTSLFKPGTYFVHILIDGETEIKQLIIK
ncbi:MAG: T9SS type A sorting domain-containing protein [Cyclobacteriaceae bacterium]